MKKVNIDEVKIVNATSPSKRRYRNSKAIGIVKNNSRVSLNKQLIEQLGSPKSVQIGTVTDEDGKHLVVAESLKDGSSFKLKGDGNLIYNVALVEKLIDFFDLDFSEKTSITFGKYEIQEDNVAVISK